MPTTFDSRRRSCSCTYLKNSSFADEGPTLSAAERAVVDRTWAYGHVVVDEAQELSAMAWRLLMRRCPAKSMTLVGDIAQTGSAAGAHSWAEVLDPYVEGRWRLTELTVNYRTPAQVMTLASAMLEAAGVTATAPRSVRDGDVPPTVRFAVRTDFYLCTDQVGRCVQHQRAEVVADV